MNPIQLRNDVIEKARKAVEMEDANKNEEAIQFYTKAINILKIIIDHDENKYNRDTYSNKITEYNDRIVYLEKLIESQKKKDKKEAIGGE